MPSSTHSEHYSSDGVGDAVDLFAEPDDYRPKTPPPQILKVPYQFTGSASTTVLPQWQSSKPDPQSTEPHDHLRIHLLGSHPLWGHHLWNASLDLARFLQSHSSTLLNGASVLELGAAAGVPSIVAAREGAECVVATDYPEKPLIDILALNLSENTNGIGKAVAVAEGFLWGSDPSHLTKHLMRDHQNFDVILMSDLIFNHQAHASLLDTLDSCLAKGPSVSATSLEHLSDPSRLQVDTVQPNFPDLPLGDLTRSAPATPCALVFFTSHRPHLAERDFAFFTEAQARGWTTERVGRWRRDPMFPEDPGSEIVRGTVHGFRIFRDR